MMRILVSVVVIVALTGPASAADRLWSVAPPAGWEDVSAAAGQQLRSEEQQKLIADSGVTEIVTYQGSQTDTLVVMFIRNPVKGAADGNAVRDFEAGTHDTLAREGSVSSYTTRVDSNMLIADDVVVISGRTIRSRRIAGIKDSQLLSVSAICRGSEAECTTALRTLTLDNSGFRQLTTHGRGVDTRSKAYKAGQAVGRIILAALVVLVLGWLLVRGRRKKHTA